MTYAGELSRLMKYVDRDDIDSATSAYKDAIIAIYDALQKKRKHADNADLMVEINQIVNEYLFVEPNQEDIISSKQFDISKIDFELLMREFSKKKKQNFVLKDLQELIQIRLNGMLLANPNRIDYMQRYQEIIDAYNSEQDRANIEKTFMDLMNLANSMNLEQQRYVREGFSCDEELSLFDMLFRDNLSKSDIKAIKGLAVKLLVKIKAKIAEFDHWTDKQETKAVIDNLIRDTLWRELPESFDDINISEYRQRIYEYFYTKYRNVA